MSERTIHVNNGMGGFHLVMSTITAMIGYAIHGSFGWCIVDFIFYPIALLKWIICQEITMTVIHEAFPWFFQ